MYNLSEIASSYRGLVGWQQDNNPSKLIAASLVETRSGLLYNSVHPLLTNDNLRAVFTSVFSPVIPAWSSLSTYRKGERVTYNSILYRATHDSTNKNPYSETEYWELYNDFSNWLEQETDKAIAEVVQDFIRTKKLQSKQLLESKTLFDGIGNVNKTNTKLGKIVGFEIQVPRSKGVTVKLEKIGLQFSEAGTFMVYIFHSSSLEPIKEISVTVAKPFTFNWVDVSNVFMRYSNDATDEGGAFYLCYHENDITGESINKNYDFENTGCSLCGNHGYMNMMKYLSVSPFSVVSDNIETLWDKNDMVYHSTNNWGLNLQLSVHCDYTAFMMDQEETFKDLVQIGVGRYFLRHLAHNPKANIDRNIKNMPSLDVMMYEIDGNPQGRLTGIGLNYSNAMKGAVLDTNGMSKLCLPCNKKGVNYTTVR